MPFSATESTCTITHSLYLFVTSTQEWTIWDATTFPYIQWDSSIGEFKISTSDYSYDVPFEILVRIFAEDLFSEPANQIYNQFQVTIKDKCRDIVLKTDIVGFTGTESVPYAWDMW